MRDAIAETMLRLAIVLALAEAARAYTLNANFYTPSSFELTAVYPKPLFQFYLAPS